MEAPKNWFLTILGLPDPTLREWDVDEIDPAQRQQTPGVASTLSLVPWVCSHTATLPGVLMARTGWIDSNDNLWLFSSSNYFVEGTAIYNAIWEFDVDDKGVGVDGRG